MKPAPFAYVRPESIDEALDALAEHGDEAKLLAGGQSLIPMLNFRLAQPAMLIDISRVGELSGLHRSGGALRIGAAVKQTGLERSRVANLRWPLLPAVLRWVAHPQIRSMGTVGGSVAHADSAAELPMALLALDARMHVRSRSLNRVVDAESFFVSHFTTALEPDEILTEIEVPEMPEGTRTGFAEFARRHGDFALAGAAAVLTVDDEGWCTGARVTLMSVAPTPLRARAAEEVLVGARLDPETLAAAAEAAIDGVEPTGDIHGSSEYRRSLARTMARTALERAAAG